jgi:hypothetical protein
VTYVIYPLPYHHGAWIPTKLTPYLVDTCYSNPSQCKFLDYLHYLFGIQKSILKTTNLSQNDLIKIFTTEISQALDIPLSDISSVYNSTLDTHNSETRSRRMAGYARMKGVSGTPWAYVNGVLLQAFPTTA